MPYTHRDLWYRVEFIGYCLALADAESVKPTLNHQSRDGPYLSQRNTKLTRQSTHRHSVEDILPIRVVLQSVWSLTV